MEYTVESTASENYQSEPHMQCLECYQVEVSPDLHLRRFSVQNRHLVTLQIRSSPIHKKPCVIHSDIQISDAFQKVDLFFLFS